MKSGVLSWVLLALFAVPAYAGHGTIEETDAAIIIEYTGDASDNQAGKTAEPPSPNNGKAPSNPFGQPAPQTPAPAPAAAAAAAAQNTEAQSRNSLQRTEQDEARRKLRMERRAARRGMRQAGAEEE